MCKEPIERDAAKADHDAQVAKKTEFFVKPRGAVTLLFRRGLVVRRRAAHHRADPKIGELHAVVTRIGVWLRGEARLVQHGIEEMPGTIASEWAASAIGSVGARSETKRQDARAGIPERRYRPAPVLPVRVSAATHSSNFSAVGAKPLTSIASDDAGIEGFKCAQGGSHESILGDRSGPEFEFGRS